MSTINIAEAKNNLDILCDEVNESLEPLLIVNKFGKNCYLIGEDLFNSLLETIFLNSVEGLSKSIIKESNTDYEEAVNVDEIKW